LSGTTSPHVTRRGFLGTAVVAATGAAAGGFASGGYFHHRAREQAAEFMAGQLFADPIFDFTTRIALGASYYGCANPGKIFAIASKITDGDFESAYQAYHAAGTEANQWAEEAARRNHRVSAREAYLWAANYFFAALYFLDGTTNPTRLLPTWKQYESCWTAAAALFTPPIERVEIPYENTTLTGWLFRASDSKERRPLVILNNGADGSELDMLAIGGAGGLARGYNCLTFNGPGQGDALWLKKMYFRPDWERQHLYFEYPPGAGIRNSASKLKPGLDVRTWRWWLCADTTSPVDSTCLVPRPRPRRSGQDRTPAQSAQAPDGSRGRCALHHRAVPSRHLLDDRQDPPCRWRRETS
jgi:hypothetical protein